MHFTTFNWLVSGLALTLAALTTDAGVRMAIAMLVGLSYLYGAGFNLWATRGRHPGGYLMAIAVVLIAVMGWITC